MNLGPLRQRSALEVDQCRLDGIGLPGDAAHALLDQALRQGVLAADRNALQLAQVHPPLEFGKVLVVRRCGNKDRVFRLQDGAKELCRCVYCQPAVYLTGDHKKRITLFFVFYCCNQSSYLLFLEHDKGNLKLPWMT